MKKTAIACISLMWLLTAAKISMGDSQNSFSPDKFTGYLRQETYGRGKPNANSPVSSSVLFQESENGSKYAVYVPFFVSPSFQREYTIGGILVQKFLPEKAKDDEYKRVIQSAWPDFTPADTKRVVKVIKDWMKENSDIPLLLISTLRAEPPVIPEGQCVFGKPIKRVSPVYPEVAKRQHIEGAVELEALIDEDGIVEQIKFVKGSILFKTAAIDAVRQWTYSPTLIGDRAVALELCLRITFVLGGSLSQFSDPLPKMSQRPLYLPQ